MFYVLWTGCQWKALPKDLPPGSTVWEYLTYGIETGRWCASTTRSMLRCGRTPDERRARLRRSSTARPQREPQRGASLDPAQRWQEGAGRKRHILTDTIGLLLAVSILPANVQDRDGAEALHREARRRFPFIERIFADAGYQGPKRSPPSPAPAAGSLPDRQPFRTHRFVVLPKRWIVERTFGLDQPKSRTNAGL